MTTNKPHLPPQPAPDQLLRLKQIIGDKKASIPPLVPVSRSNWWSGVKSGRYPQPVKLGPATTCWRLSDIQRLMQGVQS